MDASLCPECGNGKHVNCTGWAIDEDDNVVDCDCTDDAHPWNKS